MGQRDNRRTWKILVRPHQCRHMWKPVKGRAMGSEHHLWDAIAWAEGIVYTVHHLRHTARAVRPPMLMGNIPI
jgi:hypothetical protein